MKVFMVLGVILAVIGGALLVYSFTAHVDGPFDFGPEAASITGWVLFPMGVLFAAVGYWVGRMIGNSGKLLAEGLAGQATILSASDSGIHVNDRPMANLQMQVMVPGRLPYVVQHRQIIPMTALGMITPGSTLPVAVDPDDPHKLTIDWGGQTLTRTASQVPVRPNTSYVAQPNTLSPTGMVTQMRPGAGGMVVNAGGVSVDLSGVVQQLAAAGISIDPSRLANATVLTTPTVTVDASSDTLAALRAAGTPGRAVIREAHDLGVEMVGQRLYSFMLDVTPAGGVSYSTQAAGPVPDAAVGRTAPGSTVSVRIDPADPQKVMIDWDAA